MTARDTSVLRERLRAERDERRRLAELIHDGPVQYVAALTQMLDATAQALSAGDLQAAATITQRAVEVAREAGGELRAIVSDIEPASLHEQGLSAALQELTAGLARRRGIAFDLSLEVPEDLGDGAASGLYQIARESIDQSIRRGPPTRIGIGIAHTRDGGLRLRISDDAGRERRQTVLDGLAERATELNATLSVGKQDDGTTVIVTLPPSATHL